MRVSEKGHLTVLSVMQNKCDSEHAAHGVHGGAIPCHMVFTASHSSGEGKHFLILGYKDTSYLEFMRETQRSVSGNFFFFFWFFYLF